jgi:hypothetical protein
MLMYHFYRSRYILPVDGDINGDMEVMVVMSCGFYKTWGNIGKDHLRMSLPVVVVIV